MEGLNYRARWCELYLLKIGPGTEKDEAGVGRRELAGLLKGQCRGPPHVWAGQVGAEGCGTDREVEPCGYRRDLSLKLEVGSQQEVLNRAVAWT